MKASIWIIAVFVSGISYGQSIVGKWQLTEEKSCMETEFEKSDTENELSSAMGSSRNSIARIILFKKDGTGEEAVFSVGKKKGSGMSSFKYKVEGKELMLLDKKSGIAIQRLVLDELTTSTMRIHNAMRECESKTFIKIN